MGKIANLAHFLCIKINFSLKSQQKNYSTENKVIGGCSFSCKQGENMLKLYDDYF